MHERIERELGQIWQISLSQTYNILKRLETKGFIKGTLQAQTTVPDRYRFQLTPAGRSRFKAWLKTPAEPSARAIRVEFLTRLYFISTTHSQAARNLIEAQIEATQAGLARLTEKLVELPPEQTFNRLGLELRLRQLTSILEWLAECRASLSLG